MIQTFKETELTRCFVAPELCSHLLIAGLYAATAYKWRIYQKEVKITTDSFDEDNYYKDGFLHSDFIEPAQLILPAYTIKDVEKALPGGYFFTLTPEGIYEISVSSIYDLEMCTAPRMPDAFARMLLLGLRKHVLDAKTINKIYEKQEHNSNV